MNPTSTKADFDQHYQTHLKHLKLKGLQPKTIDAYSRAIRHMGEYFDYSINRRTQPTNGSQRTKAKTIHEQQVQQRRNYFKSDSLYHRCDKG